MYWAAGGMVGAGAAAAVAAESVQSIPEWLGLFVSLGGTGLLLWLLLTGRTVLRRELTEREALAKERLADAQKDRDTWHQAWAVEKEARLRAEQAATTAFEGATRILENMTGTKNERHQP